MPRGANKRAASRILAADRARKVAELCRDGATLAEAAKIAGYADQSGAARALKRYIKELDEAGRLDVEAKRHLLEGRLDKTHKRLDKIAESAEDLKTRIEAEGKIQRGVDVQARVSGVVKHAPPLAVVLPASTGPDISKLTTTELWSYRELLAKMGESTEKKEEQ